MFITNMTKSKLGVTGRITLAPAEVNHFVDDSDVEAVARISRLERAKLVSVVRESGLTKTGIKGRVVKTVLADVSAVSGKPRSKKAAVEAPAKDPAVTTTTNIDGSTTTTVKKRGRKAAKVVEEAAVEAPVKEEAPVEA